MENTRFNCHGSLVREQQAGNHAALSRDRNLFCWIERGALLLALAYLALHTIPNAWSKLITDFPNLYLTARLGAGRLGTIYPVRYCRVSNGYHPPRPPGPLSCHEAQLRIHRIAG